MENEAAVSGNLLERLKRISLFSDIRDNPEYMDRLLEICTTREFKAGERIIGEGDLGSGMYILNKGAVTIRKRTRAGDTYTVVNLRAEDNVFFGELALIDDERRSATVEARQDSECLEITKNAFIKLGNEHPGLGLPITREISRILASRLRKTNEDMMTIFDALVNELKGE
ncbi:MAG TPA: cyclic nucleotide-binding domain-containing protein [Spirochaetia bacterium]|nr:cyclic nucleotide-binding domain-containing protein [Spirochaetia bacterium]